MRYFITGCNGFVGSHIARKILDEGNQVRAIKREHSDLSELGDYAEQIEWVDVDLLDSIMLTEAIDGCEYIIHTAAMISFNPYRMEEMHQVNVEGTANIINAALQLSIKKFCHISSIAAVGHSEHSNLIDESNKWVNSAEHSGYALTKYQAEQEVWRGNAEGLNTVIVNPSVILGCGNWDKSSLQIFKYINRQEKFYPAGLLNFVDVRDVANIVIQLTQSDITGERFILNADAIPYKEAFSVMAQYLNVKPPSIKLPVRLAYIAVFLENIKTRLFKSEPRVTKDLIRSSKNQFVYKSDKVQQVLGCKFKSLNQTMEWVSGLQQ